MSKNAILPVFIVIIALIAQASIAQSTESDALSALYNIRQDAKDLQLLGYPSKYVQDQLLMAEQAFNGQNVTPLWTKIYSLPDPADQASFINALNTTFSPAEAAAIINKSAKIRYNYTAVVDASARAKAWKKKTYEMSDRLATLDDQIKGLDLKAYNFTEVLENRRIAGEKFKAEQFNEMPLLIDTAVRRIEEIQIEQTRQDTFLKMGEQTLRGYWKQYRPTILFGLVILIIVLFVAWNEYVIRKIRRKIKEASIERDVLKELQEKAQKDYFQGQAISRSLYEIKLRKYEEKRISLKERIPVLNRRLDLRRKIRMVYMPWTVLAVGGKAEESKSSAEKNDAKKKGRKGKKR